MIRPKSKKTILTVLRRGLHSQIERMVTQRPLPVRVERRVSPQVRALEPRFVLNASAELVMGQLLVTGTDASETVRLEVQPDGEISLHEGGSVIPIEMPPGGPSNSVNSTAVNDILFRMGGGDDTLDLQLPDGVDVTVEQSDGNDRAIVRFQNDNLVAAAADSIAIHSEQIALSDPTEPTIDLSNDMVELSGDVFLGLDAMTSELNVSGGSLQVDGHLILTGNVTMVGSGSIDLSGAFLTAGTTDTNLRVGLDQSADSVFTLGGADASAGQRVENFSVDSANRVVIGNPDPVSQTLSLGGDLEIRDVSGEILFDAAVDAQAVSVETDGDITITDSIGTDGLIKLLTRAGSLTIAGDLNTATQNSQAQIDLSGQSVSLVDASLTTAGGLVRVSGPVEIDGAVFVDSGNMRRAASAGPVTFFHSVQSADELGDTLSIDARGDSLDGAVRFEAPIGASAASPGARDLNGLSVKAGAGLIEVDSIGVVNGNIDLSADAIRLFGSQIRTSGGILVDGNPAGNIVVDGDLFLPTLSTEISATGNAQFTSALKGQTGTLDLRVTSGLETRFDGKILLVRHLDVMAAQARFFDDVALGGNLRVDAGTIQIAAGIDTTNGTTDGMIELLGQDLVLIQANAVLFVGQETIQIDGGGGVIDTGQSTLRSDSSADAVTIRHASRLILGNVVAPSGNVTLGIDQDILGVTDQAAGTALRMDRLTASTDDIVDLSNPGNEIASIERITSGGDITINDSLPDLTVALVDSRGNDVLISTAGSMFLTETAITALGAATTLNAARGIFDLDDSEAANVQSGSIQLVAGAEGIGIVDNPVDVDASISASADTSGAGGNISLANVGGAIPVGLIDAGTGDVNLTARTVDDDVDDATSPQSDILASLLDISTNNGIGDSRILETSVDRIVSEVTEAGATNVSEADAVVLESVVTQDGSITITAGGTMTAVRVLSRGGGDRDIRLAATGPSGDIEVRSVVAMGQSDVDLTADDDIFNHVDSVPLVADDLSLTSNNVNDDRDAAIELATMVTDFQAAVRGGNRGDIVITEVDSINLALSDARGDEIVETGNGQILINAGGDITVFDTSAGDDGEDRKSDPEIVARGNLFGRIDLQAVNRADASVINVIELQDDVQLHSEKITARFDNPQTRPNSAAPTDGPLAQDPQRSRQDRSIFLSSDSIVFGQRIELNTGAGQGVARVFSPRPEDPPPRTIDPVTGDPAPPLPRIGGIASAFFDPSTVQTNVLEQAVVNDATGILTLDIGRQGERGLTIDIDWGAPNVDDEFGRPRRFQQINGLSADEAIFVGLGGPDGIDPEVKPAAPGAPPQLRVEHFYSQANIVDSKVNDRAASTKPLEVRFSLRHHESIFVQASTVQQGSTAQEAVPGGIASSTDNPFTARETLPGLENGEATFLIPSLTIPSAFIPVRNVIPEFEEPQVVTQSEPTVTVTQTTTETVETTVSASIGRKDTLRIRVLSPDPDGDDLALPEELPDDILLGDRLKRLFAELPDGRYEIEYVLGDSNPRSVLQVDVRGGQATIPGEELEEGILRLKRLRPEAEEEPAEDAKNEQLDDLPPPENAPIGRVPAEAGQENESEAQVSSAPPILAGTVLSGAWQRYRRTETKRLSVAGRFAHRRRSSNSTCRDGLK